MTPAARVQAAIELLDAIIAAARTGGAAADTLIARYFKDRRYAGSKDRRAVRDLVYDAIRRFGDPPASGRAALVAMARDDAALALLFDGSAHAPAAIRPDEPGSSQRLLPQWLADQLAWLGDDEISALLDRAPLDLRVNTLKATRAAVLTAFDGAIPIEAVPDGLRLADNTPVEQHPLYRDGSVEIQDAGSQKAALACAARPGMLVIDLCAGAGGKALALAAAMGNQGRIIAADTDRGRLSRLPPRAARAGASIITTRLLDPRREHEALTDLADSADLVLVDAPCSGSGTWRRNPESRWRLTPARLARLAEEQARLIALAASLVRTGGRLVYVVCSLLDAEGPAIVAPMLADGRFAPADDGLASSGRRHGDGRLLTPFRDKCDGFFVSVLQKTC